MRYALILLIGSFLLAFPLVSACDSLSGQCWYVATDGSDTNPGTIEQPFGTFRPAITQAMPGDIIYARGGVYTDERAMVSGTRRVIHNVDSSEECESGQVFVDNTCFEDTYHFMNIDDWGGWASRDSGYTVEAGTASHPITVRSYPKETAVLDARGATSGIKAEKSYWIIEHLELRGSNIYMWGGAWPNNPHDITIRHNRIHDYGADGGNNIGLIKIDRGDNGGAYNIFIHNNTLHDLYDSRIEDSTSWQDTSEMQHYGAVTTLSAEGYFGLETGSTGYIEIINNTMYDVPQALFFKNPALGPIRIENNVIYNAKDLGDWSSSNIFFVNNLVYNVGRGVTKPWITRTYNNCETCHWRHGWNYTITDNTFVNISFVQAVGAYGHVVERNVVTGISSQFLGTSNDPDELFGDALQQISDTWRADNNCLVPSGSLQYLRVPNFGSYTVEQASAAFDGFSGNEIVLTGKDPLSPFTDPARNDYRIREDHPCYGLGWQGEAFIPPQEPQDPEPADPTPNPEPDEEPSEPTLVGDVDGNGIVDIQDVLLVINAFGEVSFDSQADVDGDGEVNIFDLVLVAQNFGSVLDDSLSDT